jgi:hypothetical protein
LTSEETELGIAPAKDGNRSRAMSLAAMLLLTGICALGFWILATRGAPRPEGAEVLSSVLFRLFFIAWVRANRRTDAFNAPYEFDAFLFFAWPAAMPYYFYKTRGPRGLFAAFGVFVLFIVPDTVWVSVHDFATMR